MKYLTKEWLIQYKLSYTNRLVRKSKKAEKTDEHFYNTLLQKHLSRFIELEKSSEIFSDPQKDMERVEKYVNEEGISELERQSRKRFQAVFNEERKTLIELGAPFVFDKKAAERRFWETTRQEIELMQNLPPYILSKIADIRVFVFGYASAEVKKLLNPYCAELKHKCSEAERQAERETRKAQKFLTIETDINTLGDTFLTDIEFQNGDIYLVFDDGDKLLIKDGEIVEREEEKLYIMNCYLPDSGYSLLHAAELYHIDGKFEVHFLMENRNEFDTCKIWYLTIRGTDIQEILTPLSLSIRESLEKFKENEK